MPGKGKGKSRGKSRGKRKSESLQWKFAYRISTRYMEEEGITPAEARERALRHFESTGEQMPGVHIIAKWRNKDNKNPKHANWKTSDDPGQNIQGAFRTLHGSMQRALDFEPEEMTPRKPRPAPVVSHEARSQGMKKYHAALREIKAKHPAWTHKKAQAEYRRKKK